MKMDLDLQQNQDTDDMQVIDVYDIDEGILMDKAELSDYWKKAFKFYTQVKYYPVNILSPKQKTWLENIEDQHVMGDECKR